jgi:ankyrin repeat protein
MSNGRTPLATAILHGQTEMVQHLLFLGAEQSPSGGIYHPDVDKEAAEMVWGHRCGLSAALLAAWMGSGAPIFQLLASYGHRPKGPSSWDLHHDGRTPLHLARGRAIDALLGLDAASINKSATFSTDRHGYAGERYENWPPLSSVITRHDASAAERLCAAGADPEHRATIVLWKR